VITARRLAAACAVAALLEACSTSPGPASSTYHRVDVTRPADAFPSATPLLPSPASPLPFDPSAGTEVPGRLVFAHYLPPFTVSIDNAAPAADYYARQFLRPDGEGGKHAAYGGFLRDRPQPRTPRASSSWQLLDLEDEVRTASAAGIDGFVLDIVEAPGDPDARVLDIQSQLLEAAHRADPTFRVMLMPDVSGGLKEKSVDALARYVAMLGKAPAAFRLSDGRLVVSPFNAESHSASWWAQFEQTMATSYGTKVALVPLFQDERDHVAEFAPISYGVSTWGARNPAANPPTATSPDSPVARADAVHAAGLLWMQTVALQDERPAQGVYDEAANTTTLRQTWQIARESRDEWVQLATWNDYAEGTAIAASVHHGRTFLDLTSYYATWFKTGTQPTVTRDVVYLTHRTQPYAALPTYPQTSLMKPRSGTPPRDTVEALVFATGEGIVTLHVGTTSTDCHVRTGVTVCTAPLSVGLVSAVLVRDGVTVATVSSPFAVTSSPRVQDLQYVGASSARPSP
jgi:hypothetical protein